MQPIVTTKGKSTHLRYELPQRVHVSTIYPVRAPNGSTVILYGSDSGVGILWRGGRALKQTTPAANAPSKVNGTNDAIMIIDSDDDEPTKAASTPFPKAEFEQEEEEMDPDYPYPSVVQQLRLPLNTEVLHIAVPRVPKTSELLPGETLPPIFSEKMVFSVACADFSVRVVTLPLSPPPDTVKERPWNSKSLYGEEVIKIPTYAGHQTIPAGVSMTWTSRNEPGGAAAPNDAMEVDENDDETVPSGRRSPRKKRAPSRSETTKDTDGFDLLVASHSVELGGLLRIWRFTLTETAVQAANPIAPYQTVTLPRPASKIAFNTAQYPKRRHSQLLVADSTGSLRVYDPFAPRKRNAINGPAGAFVALFRTRFENASSSVTSSPILASRKPILDAAWVSEGQSILALLADGEWGIWDVKEKPGSSRDPSVFVLRNFVGTSESEKANSGASSPKSRSNRASLVPMTPNTRRRKEETLFQGSSLSSVPPRAGLSVASLSPSNGQAAEESVVIWYGKEVYRITDLAKFRSRAAASNTGNSLPGPGLLQVHDIPLLGESIVSTTQFDTTAKDARMAVPRDILFSAEYRLIVSTTTNQPTDRNAPILSQKANVEEEATKRSDQALLAHGELGIDGMQRLLDDMNGSGSRNTITFGNPRKVLFASS